MNNITLVTGLWNIGRENLQEGWSRSFDHYLQKFNELLKINQNMIIFGDTDLESFVWERRDKSNTQFIVRDLEWIKNNTPYDNIQKIRESENWLKQSSWLADSTQGKLDMYNPLVMSKMFLLHDSKILDKFNSTHLYWIDAGLTNTVHIGYFTKDDVLEKITKKVNKFSFVCFPYQANTEIHGFSYPKINDYAGENVNLVARGGFFGGPKETISDVNGIYYNLLYQTIKDGYMGTEESVFSIILYKYPELINYFEIDGNGLLGKFFEDAKNERLVVKNKLNVSVTNNIDVSKVGLYVITFNSPKQFETLIQSMLNYDPEWHSQFHLHCIFLIEVLIR